MARIFGFTGEIGSGKTTAARLMHDFSSGETLHLEFSDSVINASNAVLQRLRLDSNLANNADFLQDTLLDTFRDVFHMPLDVDRLSDFDYGTLSDFIEMNQELVANNEMISQENKEQFRPLLQWLGYEFTKKYHSDFWSLPLEAAIHQELPYRDLITVGGVRYDANALMLKKMKGTIVRVAGRRSLDALESHGHASEKGIREELVDHTIDNSGSLAQLALRMCQLYDS